MWPIVCGIVAGVIATTVVGYGLRILNAAGGSDDKSSDRVAGLVDLLYAAFGTVVLLALVLAWHASSSVDNIDVYRIGFWRAFHYTPFASFVLSFCVGVVGASWYRDARSSSSQNLAVRGIAVAAFAAIVMLVGLNSEYRIFGRLSKFSSSVISFELEKTGPGERVELNANNPGSASNIWAANEKIGFALLILRDLGQNALDIDLEALHHFGVRQVDDHIEANRAALKTILLPLVTLREAIHKAKRDSDPIFFDSEGFEQARLALALRELVLGDLNEDTAGDDARAERVSRVADAYGAYFVSTRHSACQLGVKSSDVVQLEKDLAEVKQQVDRLEKQADIRQAGTVEAAVAKEKQKTLEARLAAAKTADWDYCAAVASRNNWPRLALAKARVLKGEISVDGSCPPATAASGAATCKSMIPTRATVQTTPYLAIVASAFLYSGGEREAAAAVLDLWSRAARKDKDPASDVPRRLFAIRVLNLVGLLLSDLSNPVQLELAANYQLSALNESTHLISRDKPLSEYAAAQKFPRPEEFDMLSAAARPSGDRRNRCESADRIKDRGPRYLVHRRATLLNNVVYFLSFQPDLLEHPDMGDLFDRKIEELRSIRVDCLANYASAKPQSEQTEKDREEGRTEALARTLDTIARALKIQAGLHAGSEKSARKSLCGAYRAAFFAYRLASAGNEQVLSRTKFEAGALEENGQTIRELNDARSTRKLLVELKKAVEAQGEKACDVDGVAD